MGGRVAARLIDVGYEVLVWNRTAAKAAPLVNRGAVAVATPAEAATQAEVLVTMVADPAALRAVVAGPTGVAAGAHGSLTMIEMSTVGPGAIAELAAALPEETALIEAPVLGGISEAETGSLAIFVGGADTVVARATPLLSALGTPIHVGPLGTGQAAKLVANATLFGALGTLGEAVALARGFGLATEAAYQVLAQTPLAAQAERRRQAIETASYPPRFRLALAGKDADLIRQSAAAAGVELRLIDAVRTWFSDAEAGGSGERDYTAILATILSRGGSADEGRASATATSKQGVAFDGLIVDLDGVVWLGGQPIDGAADAIATLRASRVRVLFLTNDPQSSRDEHAARLTAVGIPATRADVLTSSAATARFLAAQQPLVGGDVLAIGSPALRGELMQAGFRLLSAKDARRAQAVVVGGHAGFDYSELRAATTAVLNGAELYATGRDPVFPTAHGPAPATGAILAAVETATGVVGTVVGKPEPFVFEIARETLSGCARVAVVGDNLASDIAGAKRAGLDAILVLTGASDEDDVARAPFKPDLVLPTIAALPAVAEQVASDDLSA